MVWLGVEELMALYEKNDQGTSKLKNKENAESNYRYLTRNKHLLKKSIKMKVHNGRFESVHNPKTNTPEMLWTVTEPIYVMFSWKDKNENSCGFPISFHIKTNDFEEKLNKFLNIKNPQPAWQSYYN